MKLISIDLRDSREARCLREEVPWADELLETLLAVDDRKHKNCQSTNFLSWCRHIWGLETCSPHGSWSAGALTVVLGAQADGSQGFAEPLLHLTFLFFAAERKKVVMRRLFRILARHSAGQSFSGVELRYSPLLFEIGSED